MLPTFRDIMPVPFWKTNLPTDAAQSATRSTISVALWRKCNLSRDSHPTNQDTRMFIIVCTRPHVRTITTVTVLLSMPVYSKWCPSKFSSQNSVCISHYFSSWHKPHSCHPLCIWPLWSRSKLKSPSLCSAEFFHLPVIDGVNIFSRCFW